MSKYTKDGQITSSEAIRADNPNLGIPDGADLSDMGWFLVNETPQPAYNQATQRCQDSGIAEFVNGQWQTLWVVSDVDPVDAVPQGVTAFQAKSALLAAGFLEQAVSATASAGGVVKLQWETQPNFTRQCIAMKFIQRRIRLTEEQVNDLFTMAAQLSADPAVNSIVEQSKPEHDAVTQQLNRVSTLLVNGQWSVEYSVSQLDAATLQNNVVNAIQKRLDDFAATRNYDGILSACTYVTSSVPRFAAEGTYAVNARDSTWSALYTAFGEVQVGIRPVPILFSEIETILPALEWPI